MKKTAAFILAVLLTASSFCCAASAAGHALTNAEIKTLMRAEAFICDTYRLKEVGGYADELMYTVAELFPETVADSDEGTPTVVRANVSQVRGAVNHKWGFMSDATLNTYFMAGFDAVCKQKDGSYEMTMHAHGGALENEKTAKGVFEGYTYSEAGVYTLYYLKTYPGKPVEEILSGSKADNFWDEAAKKGFPAQLNFEGVTFVGFEGDYYGTERGTREYKFRFTEDGLVEYVSDGPATLTLDARFIGGDVNSDGDVDNKDVVALFRRVSGDDAVLNEYACDVNADYSVDNKDVVLLFRYCSGDKTVVPNDAPHPLG